MHGEAANRFNDQTFLNPNYGGSIRISKVSETVFSEASKSNIIPDNSNGLLNDFFSTKYVLSNSFKKLLIFVLQYKFLILGCLKKIVLYNIKFIYCIKHIKRQHL